MGEEGDSLVLPPSTHLAHEKEVVAIIDAKDYYKKEEENERRRQAAARKAPTAEKMALVKQMEADRKEKKADGPVTQSSIAQKLGDGPNIMRAGDLGIGKSLGG